MIKLDACFGFTAPQRIVKTDIEPRVLRELCDSFNEKEALIVLERFSAKMMSTTGPDVRNKCGFLVGCMKRFNKERKELQHDVGTVQALLRSQRQTGVTEMMQAQLYYMQQQFQTMQQRLMPMNTQPTMFSQGIEQPAQSWSLPSAAMQMANPHMMPIQSYAQQQQQQTVIPPNHSYGFNHHYSNETHLEMPPPPPPTSSFDWPPSQPFNSNNYTYGGSPSNKNASELPTDELRRILAAREKQEQVSASESKILERVGGSGGSSASGIYYSAGAEERDEDHRWSGQDSRDECGRDKCRSRHSRWGYSKDEMAASPSSFATSASSSRSPASSSSLSSTSSSSWSSSSAISSPSASSTASFSSSSTSPPGTISMF